MGKNSKKSGMAAEHEARKGRGGRKDRGLKALADLKLPEPEVKVAKAEKVVKAEAKVEAKSESKPAETAVYHAFVGGGVVDKYLERFQAGRMLASESAAKKVQALLEGTPIPGVVILVRGEGKDAEYQLLMDRTAYKTSANVKALREFKALLAKDGLTDNTPRA